MNLKLHKALCIFDLETTGTDISKDRIVLHIKIEYLHQMLLDSQDGKE